MGDDRQLNSDATGYLFKKAGLESLKAQVGQNAE